MTCDEFSHFYMSNLKRIHNNNNNFWFIYQSSSFWSSHILYILVTGFIYIDQIKELLPFSGLGLVHLLQEAEKNE